MTDDRPATPTVSDRIERWFVAANGAVLIALMAAMALLVIANVFARYAFNHSFVWAEELSRYLMIWGGFLGSGLVLRIGAHPAVDLVQDLLPDPMAQALRVAVVAVLAVACVAMLWLGARYVDFAWDQETPVLNWKFGLIYLAISIGALLMLAHLGLIASDYVRARQFRRDGALTPEEAML